MKNRNDISHMDGIFWFNTILLNGSWILDWLVSNHDDCDFDEFCVLDNEAKKKKVKKHRELTSVSLCF